VIFALLEVVISQPCTPQKLLLICIPFELDELILQASKAAHSNHATLFPAGQVTVPHLPAPKFEAEYAVLGVAVIVSPQFTG
jgi:hypothetical protein